MLTGEPATMAHCMEDNAALLAKIAREKRVASGKLKGKEKEKVEQLVAAGKVIKLGQAFYAAELAPSEETERRRIEQVLLSKPKLFPRSRLETRLAELKPLFRVALANLVRAGRVLELGPVGVTACFYIHRQHIMQSLSSEPAELTDLPSLSKRIRAAYRAVTERYQRDSIFIADLLSESCLDSSTLKGWIEHEIIKGGHGQLDEGDWSEANDQQRQAAVEFLGRKRLYIALRP
jgi:hypothetical protein